jgi:6-phosphogluconolactonase (cycloisomerase 2 family)
MRPDTRWSRRAFLQGVGYTSALGVLRQSIPGSKVLSPISPVGFAYVGSGRGTEGSSCIHVFEVREDQWTLKQSVPSPSPVSLALHPDQQYLYVANDLDTYEGLPRGTIEAYKIDAHDGSLAWINRQPLSLSGIKPGHVSVAPDGSHLVVAIYGGGAYNVLPIHADGTVGRVTQILKEVGSGAHPVYQVSAHPHTAAFDSAGHLVATDRGCDRISIFASENGKMIRTAQVPTPSGSGPGHLVLHPSNHFLYVSNTLDRSMDCYRWDAGVGQLRHQQRVMTGAESVPGEAQNLVISSSGEFLYAASPNRGISVWGIDPPSGELSFRQLLGLKQRFLRSLILSPDHQRIFATDSHQHEILSIPVCAENGELGKASVVARAVEPRCLVLRYS